MTTATASPSARTITGLAVPYGPAGNTAYGPLTFAPGALTWTRTGRVKLLVEHDPNRSVGYATDLTEADDGLHATFAVPDGEAGDLALQEAADGRRDGLSVGVVLSDDTWTALVEADGTPVPASGQLVEISQVSVPAFDDARIPASLAATAGPLIVSFTTPPPPPPRKVPAMTVTAQAEPVAPAEAETITAAAPTPFPTSFHVESEPPVYTFGGDGPSFVRDMWHARFDGDLDAQARVHRFNGMWQAQEARQLVPFLTAAVETRATAPNWIQQGYAPQLLVETIDKGRPIVSRVGTVGLTDATPFRIPIEGDFTGVAAHTEGTSHVAEGDMTMNDVTVTPGAFSGAYRLSREVIDASNPAIDQMATRAMLRNYRYATETAAVAALEASDSTATASIDTVLEVRAQLNGYFDTMFEDASAIAASPSWYATLLNDKDTTGRPLLAEVNPSNTVGTKPAGFTGAEVSGTEIFKSGAVAATMAYLFNYNDLLIGESSVLTFRFEEVEGPGIIKLALWSYFVAKVTRAGSVVKVTSV